MAQSEYLQMLRARHTGRLLGGTLLGRLPNAMGALALVLLTRAEGGDYTLAGILSAIYGVGCAVGQPLLGRVVDRRGQPVVMAAAATLSAAGYTAFAAFGPQPFLAAVAAVAVAGVFTPPLEAGLRALWPSVLRRDELVHTAYVLDASAQEVMYAGGPLLVTLTVSWASERAAVVLTGLLGLAGTLVVVTSAPSRAWRGEPHEPHWLGPLRAPGLRALFAALFFVGGALGAISVSAVAYADAHGGAGLSGWLLGGLGVGALAGGLSYGSRRWPGSAERRLKRLMAALALGFLPLALTPGVLVMIALSALAGVFLAPALACAFVVVDRHAPAGTVTEAFSWLVTAFGIGNSMGAAAAGPAVQYGDVQAGYGTAAASGAVAMLVLLATGRALTAGNEGPAVLAGLSAFPDR